MQQSDKFVCIGIVGKPHGVRGCISIVPFVESSVFFDVNSVLYIDSISRVIDSCFAKNKHYIVKLSNINNRETAKGLCCKKVFALRSSFDDLYDDCFYACDLNGLAVYSDCGEQLGIINNVEDYGAGAFLSILLNNQKIATIQFNKQSILSVNKHNIVIDKSFLIL